MDHNYESILDPIIFTILGGIFLLIAFGFRDLKNWGWYGLIGINGLVVILALINITRPENIAITILSGASLYGLLAPATKACLAGRS